MSRYGTCLHEVGHAVVGTVLGFHVHEVVLGNADPEIGGTCRVGPSRNPTPASIDSQVLDLMAMSFAGRIAEARIVGEGQAREHARTDLEDEHNVITLLSDRAIRWGPQQRATAIAEGIVERHWYTINDLALRLFISGRLTGDEVRAAVEERRASGSSQGFGSKVTAAHLGASGRG